MFPYSLGFSLPHRTLSSFVYPNFATKKHHSSIWSRLPTPLKPSFTPSTSRRNLNLGSLLSLTSQMAFVSISLTWHVTQLLQNMLWTVSPSSAIHAGDQAHQHSPLNVS